MPSLTIEAPDGEISHLELGTNPILIGREGNVDILLTGPEVSRKHARIVSMQGEYVLEDLGSANGTSLNGQPVTRPTTLKNQYQIKIADYTLTMECESNDLPSPALVGQSSPVQTRRSAARRIGLGRVEGNALVIADSSISRKHAQLIVSAQSIEVIDLGSSNGTRVNGQPVNQQTLNLGDTVQFGNVVFKLSTEGDSGDADLGSFFQQLRSAETSYKCRWRESKSFTPHWLTIDDTSGYSKPREPNAEFIATAVLRS